MVADVAISYMGLFLSGIVVLIIGTVCLTTNFTVSDRPRDSAHSVLLCGEYYTSVRELRCTLRKEKLYGKRADWQAFWFLFF